MSDFSVITNKYTAKAEYSGNIINGIYKFDETVCDESIITELKYTDENLGEHDLAESPIAHPYQFGGGFMITSTVTGAIELEGTDYLGQPIKTSVSVSTSGTYTNTVDEQFKYITRVYGKGNISIKFRSSVFCLPFKTTKVLALVVDSVDTTVSTSTLSKPDLAKNVNGKKKSRGSIFFSGSKGNKVSAICVADNSLVTIDGKEVGGLYGNPSIPE